MTAYTDATAVAAVLGAAIPAGVTGQLGTFATAATEWVEAYCGRAWQGSSPLTETHRMYGDRLWTIRPITAVTSLSVRGVGPSEVSDTLTVDEDYRVLDAASGEISLPGHDGQRVTVVYTTSGTVPVGVAQATTLIVASWLTNWALHPERAGVAVLSLPGPAGLRLEFDKLADSYGIPPEALALLAPYRKPVVV